MQKSINSEYNQEIIVYLIDYKSEGENYYDDIIFDFLLLEDWNLFCRMMHIERGENSLMILHNHFSTKRLMRGCYYSFRVDKLKRQEFRIETLEDSALFAYSFNLQSHGPQNGTLLFDKHSPIDKTKVYARATVLGDFTMPGQITDGLLRVNDVEQGNHNEIINEGNVVLVYDMGASLHSTKSFVRQLIADRIEVYQHSKPILVISHWDYDHIIQLKHLTSEELKCFSHVICPTKTKSVMSKQILRKIYQTLPQTSIHVMANRARLGKDYPLMRKTFDINGFALYIGEEHRNINYSGLVLFVHGKRGNALLTGDCALIQASDVLDEESQHLNHTNRSHKLVVPHHGGSYTNKRNIYLNYSIPDEAHGDVAIISVGENNRYGHPDDSVLQQMEFTFDRIRRTDEEMSPIIEEI